MRQLNTNINPNRQTLNTSISPFVQTLNAQIDSKLIYAFSPIANISLLPNGNYLITITDRDGTTTAQIRHGEKGDTGNGIASIEFNDDYTLTFHFTDGTEDFTTEPIRGAKGDKGDTGNGISSIVLNDDYTLTINYTEGQSYTTSSIRGEKGDTGVSISEVSLNDDYTLTINFSDGTFTRTTSIRGQTGPAPAITTNKVNKVTTIYADGQPIGTINDGQDGHSPVVTTSKSEGVTTIYIDGISAGTIIDGHSPEMSASKVGKVTTISIDGQALAVINDGVDAVAPVITANKENKTTSIYADGVLIGTVLDGQDGNSPIITTSRNGKIITILADGRPVGTVNDGEVGDPGVYVGENEPTDPDVQLWIDTDGTPNYDIPTGGSTGQVLTKTSGDDYDVEWANVPTDSVQDVQVNGVSILGQDGVANISAWSTVAHGVTREASTADCKSGNNSRGVSVRRQYASAFYGLAEAAGDTTQSQSSNPVGTYTDDAKSAIQTMLDVPSTSDVPSVDNTLSVTGAAADAKKVGDELTSLNGDLNELPHIKDSDAEDVDLDVSDANGNVIVRFAGGHIKTKHFDSSESESDLAFETYLSDVQTAVDGKANTFTIQHDFKKGEKIIFHMFDGYSHMEYGRYAFYYEGNKVIASNRRGSNGYFEHIISADCASVKVVVNAGQYTAGTSLQLAVYIIRKEVVPKVVTVASDGTGMFATIKEAVESITEANHVTNPYIIEVAPGIYNTLEGYSDEIIATSTGDSTGFQGVLLTDGISIKGMGMTREDVILTATLDTEKWNSTIRGGISTLNVQGTGSIENLTIDANNIRYCVHDDFTTPRNESVSRTVKNVKFTGDHIAYYPQFTSYGAGAGSPRNFVFKDCDFGYDLGIHTQGGYAYGCTVLVENCIGHRFRIGDKATADTDAVNDFVVNNCNFDIIAITHSTNLTKPHIKLSGVGNENVIVKCLATDIYQLGMIDKTENGLTVSQMVKRTSGSTSFEATNNKDVAYGIVIFNDSKYSYIIRSGYVASNILGLTGLAVGDYVTVDSNGLLTVGGTANDNVGVVTWLDADGNAYIRLNI